MSDAGAEGRKYLKLSPNGWIVLGIVSYSNEVSGYQVKKWSDFGPGFFYLSPSFSQIYAELKRLEDLGLVTSRDALPDDTNARNRRLYRITEAGEQALTDWSRHAPVERPVLKQPMLMRVMLAHLGDPVALKTQLLDYIDWADLQSRHAAHYAQFAANDPYFAYVWIVLRWAERYYASESTLAGELLKDIDLAAGRFARPDEKPEWFEAPMFSDRSTGVAEPRNRTERST